VDPSLPGVISNSPQARAPAISLKRNARQMHESRVNRHVEEVSSRRSLSEYKASPELSSKFVERAEIVAFPCDQVLFRLGEAAKRVYFVLKGEVWLLLPVSKESAVGFRAEYGSLIGLQAAFGNEPFSMTAVASADSEIAVMESEEFCQMVESDSALSIDALRIVVAENRAARIAINQASQGCH